MKTVHIRFDGGTPCNVPSKGYGIGYGSYQINDEPIVRVDHGRPMSANTAEVLTLVQALSEIGGETTAIVVMGDSQVALKWLDVAAGHRRATKLANVSPEFREAVQALCAMFSALTSRLAVRAQWTPRAESVALFGH